MVHSGVSANTVTRYRRIDKWDERYEKVQKKRNDDLDINIAEQLKRHWVISNNAIAIYLQNMPDEVTTNEYIKLAELQLTKLLGIPEKLILQDGGDTEDIARTRFITALDHLKEKKTWGKHNLIRPHEKNYKKSGKPKKKK